MWNTIILNLLQNVVYVYGGELRCVWRAPRKCHGFEIHFRKKFNSRNRNLCRFHKHYPSLRMNVWKDLTETPKAFNLKICHQLTAVKLQNITLVLMINN